MPNYAKVGGVLSIISGALGIVGTVFFIGLGILFAFMPGIFENGYYYDGNSPDIVLSIIGVVYVVMGIIGALIGALAIVGGALGIRRKYWGWALAGSIAGTVVFFPCGVPAIIFTSLGKPEFESPGPPAAPPQERVIG